jgi:hypothetical protein
VYVASRAGALDPAKIWTRVINTAGHVGVRELVLDLGTYAGFSSRLGRSINFSTSGEMDLTTDAPAPFLLVDRASGSIGYFYRGILPPTANIPSGEPATPCTWQAAMSGKQTPACGGASPG